MKKIITLLLCLLVLVGCSGTSENTEKKNYANASSIADFAGAKLAGQAGTIHGELASQIEYGSFNEYPTVPDELVALKSGAIDGYICEEPQAVCDCAKDESITYIKLINNDNGFATTVEQSGLAIGCAKGSELVAKINKVMADASFDASKQSALMQIMGNINAGVEASQDVLVYNNVDSDLVLKVGMECASAPYNWTDTEVSDTNYPIANNAGYYADGYDVQVSAYIASVLGMKLEVYAYEWDSLIPAVESGAIDAIIAGMSPTAERKEKIDFSDVYYDTNFVIVVNK